MSWIDESAALIDAHAAALGETVTITEGGQAVDLVATITEDRREIDDVNGHNVTRARITAQIALADLILDGVAVLPRRGMRLERTVGANTLIYEFQPPAGTDQVYQFQSATLAVIYATYVKTLTP